MAFSISSFMNKSRIGIDIGTASIKAVEVEAGKTPKIINYAILEKNGYLDRANDIIQSSAMKISEKDASEILKTLLSKAKFKTQEAVISLPIYTTFNTLLELPQMPEGDMSKTMKFQISQHIPLPIEEVTIDWVKVGEEQDANGNIKQLIFLISIPNEQVVRYQNICKMAGLKLRALEIESLSLIRSLVGSDPTATLIVDIGNYSTNVLVAHKGFLKQSGQSDYAGISLTKAIANGLGVGIRRAEEMKMQKAILVEGGDYELSTLISPFLDAILNEAVRVKNAFEQARNSKIERVILTGGGSNMMGIDKYFERRMSIPVAIGNPFLGTSYNPEIEPFVRDLGPRLSVAMGLAVREI